MTERWRTGALLAAQRARRWYLDGDGPAGVELINDFLGYVAGTTRRGRNGLTRSGGAEQLT